MREVLEVRCELPLFWLSMGLASSLFITEGKDWKHISSGTSAGREREPANEEAETSVLVSCTYALSVLGIA
eukprot:1564744-Rhodomonas_salina.2